MSDETPDELPDISEMSRNDVIDEIVQRNPNHASYDTLLCEPIDSLKKTLVYLRTHPMEVSLDKALKCKNKRINLTELPNYMLNYPEKMQIIRCLFSNKPYISYDYLIRALSVCCGLSLVDSVKYVQYVTLEGWLTFKGNNVTMSEGSIMPDNNYPELEIKRSVEPHDVKSNDIDSMKPSLFDNDHYKYMGNAAKERHHAALSNPYSDSKIVLNDDTDQIAICLEMNPSEDLALIFTERAIKEYYKKRG